MFGCSSAWGASPHVTGLGRCVVGHAASAVTRDGGSGMVAWAAALSSAAGARRAGATAIGHRQRKQAEAEDRGRDRHGQVILGARGPGLDCLVMRSETIAEPWIGADRIKSGSDRPVGARLAAPRRVGPPGAVRGGSSHAVCKITMMISAKNVDALDQRGGDNHRRVGSGWRPRAGGPCSRRRALARHADAHRRAQDDHQAGGQARGAVGERVRCSSWRRTPAPSAAGVSWAWAEAEIDEQKAEGPARRSS